MTKRRLKDLSDKEIRQLRLLNQKLMDVERWIRQRAARCLKDYYAAGGVKTVDTAKNCVRTLKSKPR